jgi:hypothetical protein
MKRLIIICALAVVVIGVFASPASAADSLEVQGNESAAIMLTTEQVSAILVEAWGVSPRLQEISFEDWVGGVLACTNEAADGSRSASVAGGSGVSKSAFESCLNKAGGGVPDGSIDGYLGALGAGGDPAPVDVDCGTSNDTGQAGDTTKREPLAPGDEVLVDLTTGETLAEQREDALRKDVDVAYENAKEATAAYAIDEKYGAALENAGKAFLGALQAVADHVAKYGSHQHATDPTAEEGCYGSWEQVNRCAQSGYEAYECWWLAPSDECVGRSDPAITDPVSEGGEPQESEPCAGDAGAAAAAVREGCDALVNPSPDGEACAGESAGADVGLEQPLPRGCAGEGDGGELKPAANADGLQPQDGGTGCLSQTCVNDVAMPEQDTCLGEIDGPASVTELQAQRTAAGESLLNGIGIITPTLPDPSPDPAPGPQPEEPAQVEQAAPPTYQP